MGPSSSKEPNKKLTINHPKFTNIKFNEDKQQVQVSIPYNTEKDLIQWQAQYRPLLRFQCLLLPKSYTYRKNMLCNTQGSCNIRFENYENILREEIKERARDNPTPFKNEQIWYIMYVILEAASIFHQQSRKVGDIRPQNIFINDSGQMKIGNRLTFPHELTNYDKSLLEKQTTYLAPQQIKGLIFSKPQSSNFELAESFSIGLTLLDVALLCSSEDIYNFTYYRIEYEQLYEKKQLLLRKNNLDLILKDTILRFLEVDHDKRLKCSQVYQRIKSIDAIKRLQPFDIFEWDGISDKELKRRNIFSRNSTQKIEVIKEISEKAYSFAEQGHKKQQAIGKVTTKLFDKSNVVSSLYKDPDYPTFSKPSQVTVSNGDKFDLSKIDQQLARSREMFPS